MFCLICYFIYNNLLEKQIYKVLHHLNSPHSPSILKFKILNFCNFLKCFCLLLFYRNSQLSNYFSFPVHNLEILKTFFNILKFFCPLCYFVVVFLFSAQHTYLKSLKLRSFNFLSLCHNNKLLKCSVLQRQFSSFMFNRCVLMFIQHLVFHK